MDFHYLSQRDNQFAGEFSDFVNGGMCSCRKVGIATGICETEYGYISANELADICVQGWKVRQTPHIRQTPLSQITDRELQYFLSRLYDK